MAESDWTEAADSLGVGVVRRAVTAGITPPNGGGSFVFGFNSIDLTAGAVALFTNLVNFAPTAANKGGSIRGAIRRGASGGNTGFAPFLFIGLQGTSVNDQGYLLGLADGDPAHIALRKGSLVGGLPDVAPPGSGILRRSTGTIAIDTWVHLRLDMIVNLNGDVRLQVFQNDLVANPLSGAPVWTAITGMTEFVDDALGVNSGSLPFTSGRIGFGFQSQDVTRRGYVDHAEVFRQL